MGIWYEGNLNKDENRHEENGVTYFVRGVRVSDGVRYERYAVKTHFIERGENLVDILRRYVAPLYQPGDVVTISEKVVSMCQNNTVEMKDVHVGFWARFLSKFATSNHNGIGMNEDVYKRQSVLYRRFHGQVVRGKALQLLSLPARLQQHLRRTPDLVSHPFFPAAPRRFR